MSEPLTREQIERHIDTLTRDKAAGDWSRSVECDIAKQLLATMDALDTLRRELREETARGARLVEAARAHVRGLLDSIEAYCASVTHDDCSKPDWDTMNAHRDDAEDFLATLDGEAS